MTLQELKKQVSSVVADVLGSGLDADRFDIGRSADPRFGDFATNAAMVYAKALKRPPRDVAEQLAAALRESIRDASKVDVAGPGFINITLTDESMGAMAMAAPGSMPTTYEGQRVVTEYSDPNPFKVLHVGHLYTSVVGDSITKLINLAGGQVHPVNFGGDVGLHVGKTMWAILHELGGEHADKLDQVPIDERSEWMAKCYVLGTKAYEEDEVAKEKIIALNKRVYAIHEKNDRDSQFACIYWTCRSWSYDYFNAFYARIGTKFEKYYPESETSPLGLATVKEQLAKGVYKKSDGAVVFEGEPYGLHTRVFITSSGLPTYEAKDVGLIMTKWQDYHFDRSVVITGNDITEYMKVVLKSIEQYDPEVVVRTTHIAHGNVKLAGGVKMSSRKGNFLRATDVLDLAAEANRIENGRDDEQVVLGAVKYAFLKQRIGGDIIYVPEESVSLEGNSGPYLQYAHARARSILSKSDELSAHTLKDLQRDERALASKIGEYPEIVQQSVTDLMPHHVCTYLYELAQVFNRFYEHNRVIGDSRQSTRIMLVESYANVLRGGLNVLGIAAPDRL